MEYSTKKIDEHLNSLHTKDEKLNYLGERLFNLKKKSAEFLSFSSSKLEILKEITKQDFTKYHLAFLNGKMIYWYEKGTKYEYVNRLTAERLGIENYEILVQRLKLENEINNNNGQIVFLESLIEKIKNESNNIYLIKGGKQVMSTWDYLEKTDFIKKLYEEHGAIMNPTHDFKLLKPVRLELYEQAKTSFIEERNLKKVEITSFELNSFLYAWLKNELKVIDIWLAETYPNGKIKRKPSTSDQIEILKYKTFVTGEMAKSLKELNPTQQIGIKTEQDTIEVKPVLKIEAVQIVFETIKDFFNTEQQNELKRVLETGNNASKKLLFRGNGNRLTDTFKKLIEHDFITGCQKQDLINWIILNFTFINQNKVKTFIYDTVEKVISRNYYPCKSPLIEIKNGQIRKVEQPRIKKYSNH
ncbi:MAG: hypothetical protein M3Q95_00665 [Bacteroidota bacterium]|nr:hypothetical protein [Bacteroidota bacterium]